MNQSIPKVALNNRVGGVAGGWPPAEGVDANPRTARGCGVGGQFPLYKKQEYRVSQSFAKEEN